MNVEVRWLDGSVTRYTDVKVLRTLTGTMPSSPAVGDLALVPSQVRAVRILDPAAMPEPAPPVTLNTFDGT